MWQVFTASCTGPASPLVFPKLERVVDVTDKGLRPGSMVMALERWGHLPQPLQLQPQFPAHGRCSRHPARPKKPPSRASAGEQLFRRALTDHVWNREAGHAAAQ
jgi:hypothetical protein